MTSKRNSIAVGRFNRNVTLDGKKESRKMAKREAPDGTFIHWLSGLTAAEIAESDSTRSTTSPG
jgi:hypothetical protein